MLHEFKGTWQSGGFSGVFRFLMSPLHYLSSRSEFGFKFAEIFVFEKRLFDSLRRGVDDSPIWRVGELLTHRLGELASPRLPDSASRRVAMVSRGVAAKTPENLPHCHVPLKVHKHEIYFLTFCRNWNLMVPGACNTRFLTIIFDWPRYSTYKHFGACSASDEIISLFAQPAMKSFPRMLSQRWNAFHECSAIDEIRTIPCVHSIFWMMFLKRVVISCYAEHAPKLVIRWLSMHGNWLLVDHVRKLVTLWLSIRGNLLLIGWA